MKIVLFSNKKNTIIDIAVSFLKKETELIDVITPDTLFDENKKNYLREKDFDYLISFLNPILIKEDFLLQKKCVNFHPSLPKYRGVCCASLALLNEDKYFGGTLHMLDKKIDKGDILMVKKIKIYENEDCFSLSYRSKICCLELLYEFIDFVKKYETFPEKNNTFTWGKELMTYKKFKNMITFKKKEKEENYEYFKKIEKCVKNDFFPGPFVEL